MAMAALAQWLFPLLSLLSMALVALPFIGYARTQRLQGVMRDPRLAALGLFFLLYGLAAVVQSGGMVAVWASDEGPFPPPGTGARIGPEGMGENGTATIGAAANERSFAVAAGNGTGNGTFVDQFVFHVRTPWTFWLHHGLVIAALAVASFAYVRPAQGMAAMAAMPVVFATHAVLQTVEAVLALLPAVLAFLNWRARRTRGSLQVALGFWLLAVSHIASVAFVLARTDLSFRPLFAVPLFELFALAGITTLVLAVPRGT